MLELEESISSPTITNTKLNKQHVIDSICRIDPDDPNLTLEQFKKMFSMAQRTLWQTNEKLQILTLEMDQIKEQDTNVPKFHDEKNKKHVESPAKKMEKNSDKKNKNIDGNTDDDDDSSICSSNLEQSLNVDELQDLTESLQKKNKYIKELLMDMQAIDEENKVLRNELMHLKDKLSEATTHIKKQTILITNAKNENNHNIEKYHHLKKVEAVLQSQIEALTESNKNYETQLDEFVRQMDFRINDWEDVMEAKETENKVLKSEVQKLKETIFSMDQRDPEFFNEMIKQRDIQIEELQAKLAAATEDILSSTKAIENLKKDEISLKLDISNESIEDINTVEKLTTELRKLKNENEDLERCLKIKEIELAEALEQVNCLDLDDENEIKDVMKISKKCKQQLKIRDEHIRTLIAENNNYTRLLDQLQLENSVMRKKLNLPPERPISTENILSKYAKIKKEFANNLKKVSTIDEENVSLKIRLRQKDKTIKKLYEHVKRMGIQIPDQFLAVILGEENIMQQAFEFCDKPSGIDEPKPNTAEIKNNQKDSVMIHSKVDENNSLMNEKYLKIVEENKNLKTKFTHVLKNLLEKATNASSELDTKQLENVLLSIDGQDVDEICDSGLIINHVDLGSLLKETRMKMLSTLDLLTKESQKNIDLQQKLSDLQNEKTSSFIQNNVVKEKAPDILTFGQITIDEEFSRSRTIEDYLKIVNNSYSSDLHNNLKHFHKQFETLYDNMIEIFNQSVVDKENSVILENQYKNEIQELTVSLESMKIRLDEMEKLQSIEYAKKIDANQNNISDKDIDYSKMTILKDEENKNTNSNVKETESSIQVDAGININETDDKSNDTSCLDINCRNQRYFALLSDKVNFERRAEYLRESLKLCKSEINNLKSELHQFKMKYLEKTKFYELELQRYKLNTSSLKNAQRKCIPFDLYIKQNIKLNEIEIKYRETLNNIQKSPSNNGLNNDKMLQLELLNDEIKELKCEKNELCTLLKNTKEKVTTGGSSPSANEEVEKLTSNLAKAEMEIVIINQKSHHLEKINSTLTSQLNSLNSKCEENIKMVTALESRINYLEKENFKLQEKQGILINSAQTFLIQDENQIGSEAFEKINKLNDHLQLENIQLSNKIEILEEQMNDADHNKLINDLEINLLQHQILDLQSGNDNKAIISRLSGEILVSHMYSTEMHNKKEKIIHKLEKEKEKCKKLESIIQEKDVQFDNYVSRTNFKISFLSTVLQIMREQYQGSVPLAVLENIKNIQIEARLKLEEINDHKGEVISMKNKNEENKFITIIKEVQNNNQCFNENISPCPHYVEMKLKEAKWNHDHTNLSLSYNNLVQSHEKLQGTVLELEENILMLTFAFGKEDINNKNLLEDKNDFIPFHIKRSTSLVEVTDINTDDLDYANSQEQRKPIPLPRTTIKTSTHKSHDDDKIYSIEDNLPGSPVRSERKPHDKITAIIQTDSVLFESVGMQTDLIYQEDYDTNASDLLKDSIEKLQSDLKQALILASERSSNVLDLQAEKLALETKNTILQNLIKDKDIMIEDLKIKITNMENSNHRHKSVNQTNEEAVEIDDLKSILKNLKSIESDKDSSIEQYKELLRNEKSEHNKTSVLAQKQIIDMKIKIETLEREHNSLKELMTKPSHVETYNSSMEKYRSKILELEDCCFRLQRDIDHEHALLLSSKSECERWKKLAAERFANMEMLKKRLEESHVDEVDSYKTETNHWLTELTSCKQDLSNIKVQFNDQKASSLRMISERNVIIDKLHEANANLKQQILNLQSVISANDPTFDLAAIIELDEDNPNNADNNYSQSDKFECKPRDHSNEALESFERTLVIRSNQQSNWSETLLERLRREKHMLLKQNTLLRRQIRLLSARERRARLELQNIKSHNSKKYFQTQLNKNYGQHEEVLALHKKIESLESQLSENNSVSFDNDHSKSKQMAMWEKQKRYQESSEKWKQRFHEKCSELEKLRRNFESSRVVVQRLEKEKRVLDSRLSKHSRDDTTPSTINDYSEGHLEMLLQDKERLENEVKSLKSKLEGNFRHSSLLERLEMQQRRIATLELAEKGKDVLVNEYERLLAQNSLLAKQNIKLESEFLENQLSNVGKRLEPDGSDGENLCCKRTKQQNQHLESYIKLLKEENSQLIAKHIELNSHAPQSSAGTLNQAKRVADLERTVLTLRGLVSKLQADNKRLQMGNGRLKKNASQLLEEKFIDDLKLEIEKLKNIIKEKDGLLQRAKELLNKAAEKEKQLYREIAFLREVVK